MSRSLPIVVVALVGLLSCGHEPLPLAEAAAIDALAAERPLALLFSTRGCRYCDLAERGFSAAARELGATAHVRKVMVRPDNVRALRARFGLKGTPDARLVLADGRTGKLPLTREGPAVAKAVRDALAAPPLRRATIAP